MVEITVWQTPAGGSAGQGLATVLAKGGPLADRALQVSFGVHGIPCLQPLGSFSAQEKRLPAPSS